MYIIGLTLLLVLIVYGIFISRWHGGGFIPGAPKVLKNFLWAAPLAGVAFLATSNYWVYGIALGLCMIGKGTGHGRGFRLFEPMEPGSKPEKVEYLILWLYDRIPLFWYKMLIMSLAGLAAVIGAAAPIGYVEPLAGVALVAAGILKAFSYWVGEEIYPVKGTHRVEEFDEATEIGEGLTGFFAYAALALAIILLVVIK